MNFIIINLVIPLVIGVLASFIAASIIKGQGKSLTRRDSAIFSLVVAGVIAIGFLLFLSPYSISGVNWCADSNQSVNVTGQLIAKIIRTSVRDEEVQIKIFVVGEDHPIVPGKNARTSADGMFAVTFPPPLPSADKNYLINTAYKHYILFIWEKWEIFDFKVGDLSQCPTQ